MRKVFAGLLAALIAVATVAQPVLAADPLPAQAFGFQCENGVCRLRLDMGVAADEGIAQAVWLEVMQDALRQAPDGAGLILDDAITITMPTGVLSLTDAQLFAMVDDTGAITNLHGSALLPLPTFGLMGDVMLVTPTRVEFGYDLGSRLGQFDAPLMPDRRYVYLKADAGLQVLTAAEPNLAVTATPAVPGQHVAVVADLTQPMLWFDGDVTVRTDGQIAFLRELMEPAEGVPWLGDALPEVLPLRQTVTWSVTGQAGRGIDPQLAVGATMQVDAGLAGTWLALDSVPLVARGSAMISPAGLLVSGSASTDVSPTQFFGADMLAQVFVPFQPAVEMTAEVAAGVHVPFLGIDQVASGRIAGDPQHVIAVTQGAWQSLQTGATGAGEVAVAGWDWAAMQGEDGYRHIIEQAGRGWSLARATWCGVAGRCGPGAPLATAHIEQETEP